MLAADYFTVTEGIFNPSIHNAPKRQTKILKILKYS